MKTTKTLLLLSLLFQLNLTYSQTSESHLIISHQSTSDNEITFALTSNDEITVDSKNAIHRSLLGKEGIFSIVEKDNSTTILITCDRVIKLIDVQYALSVQGITAYTPEESDKVLRKEIFLETQSKQN